MPLLQRLRLALGAPVFFLLLLAAGGSNGTPQAASWVIVGAQVADGTGAPLRAVNVRVVGDTIREVGEFEPREGESVINAAGLVLAPGFIDIHNHSAESLATQPLAESQISQGITTVVLGPDGNSPWPIGAFLERHRRSPPAVNLAVFVGHATLRRVMGDGFRRAARPEEIVQMERLVEQAMREGAMGLSTGLEYDVGLRSDTGEVIALARVAARYGGIYMTHIRDEADRALEAMAEAIAIGEQAGIPVQISHIKLGTVGVWNRAAEAVALVEQARARGVDVTADAYPYDAWASTITVLVPSRRHTNRADVERGLEDVGGAGNVTIVRYTPNPEYEFRTLEEIARQRNITPVDLYIEIVRAGGASVVCRSMVEADIRAFYTQPWVMVASDGGIGARHPRGAGTFSRVLGRYVREQGWLTLPEAVRKMTSLPAHRLGWKDRGRIAPGMKADLVLFDAAQVIDRSTFSTPSTLSAGIERVWVNGLLVWTGTSPAGARPGKVLAR